jgi:hypothetical protein
VHDKERLVFWAKSSSIPSEQSGAVQHKRKWEVQLQGTCSFVWSVRTSDQSLHLSSLKSLIRTNDDSEWLLVSHLLAVAQHLLDSCALLDPLAACLLQVHEGPVFRGEEALAEDVVRDMAELLKVRLDRIELDALRDGGRRVLVRVLAEPRRGWGVGYSRSSSAPAHCVSAEARTDDEPQRGLLTLDGPPAQDVLKRKTALDFPPVVVLPERHRPVLRVDEALPEHVLEHVLEVGELMRLVVDVDELRRRGLVARETYR